MYSIEIVEALGLEAARRLKALGYDVESRIGDGSQGWATEAPFDAIIVTAAPVDEPPALLDQLKPGGKLVLPVGPQFGHQTLRVVEKRSDGTIGRRAVLSVRFVPLTGVART